MRCGSMSTARSPIRTRSPWPSIAGSAPCSIGSNGGLLISWSRSPITGSRTGSISTERSCWIERRLDQPCRASLDLPAPEQVAGGDVDPFEAAIDALEMHGHEIARLGLELIDEKGAARAQRLVGLRGDRGADSG